MSITNSNSSYRKWGVGLGIAAAAVLSGYLALKPAKKNIIPPSAQPAAKILEPTKRIALERTIEFAEAAERARLANFDSGIKPEPKDKPDLEESPQPSEPNKGLKQLFAELNDDPIPTSEVNGRAIETNGDSVCYKPFWASEVYGDKEYELIIGGKSVGYINLRSSADPFDEISGHDPLYGVFDIRGNLIGYRNKTNFMSSWVDFFSRGNEDASFFQDAFDEHFIYRSGNLHNPIGKVNEETGDILDVDGEVLGRVAKDQIYLPLRASPRCEGGGGTTQFLKFGSEADLEGFLDGIKRSIGSDWEKLVKPRAEDFIP